MEHNLPQIVLTLLQHGVDWSSRSEPIFAAAIASQNTAMIKLLLRSRIPIRGDLLDSSLPVVVTQGRIENVSLLVTYGANIGYQNSSALRKAVQAQRIDLVLAIMKGVDVGAASEIASSTIGDSFSSTSALTPTEQRLLVEILLCAGAKGDPVAKVLIQAVRARHRSIAKLLVKHGAGLDYNNAEALRVAVAANNLDMLSTLLLGRISKQVAGSVVEAIPNTCSDERTASILSLLITKGATGPPLDRALVRAVQRKGNKSISLLLDHEANINMNDSQPLRMAVTDGDVPLLCLLLGKGKPDARSMEHLLPLIPRSPLEVRMNMTRSILNAAGQGGVPTVVLNNALIEALTSPSRADVEHFLPLLVDCYLAAGASVNAKQGKCFHLAAEIGSMNLLELLLGNAPEAALLGPAITVCMKLGEANQRRDLASLLLKHGARGKEVDQALIDAIAKTPMDKVLVHSLMEHADLEYLGGRALATAMQRSVEIVASVIGTGRTSRKTRLDAAQILFDPNTKNRQAKMSLLLQAGIDQEGLNLALIKEICNKRNGHIVKLLLDHKASCDYNGGMSLKLAIEYRDEKLLEQLIAKRPNEQTLVTMVPDAMAIKDTDMRSNCLKLLV